MSAKSLKYAFLAGAVLILAVLIGGFAYFGGRRTAPRSVSPAAVPRYATSTAPVVIPPSAVSSATSTPESQPQLAHEEVLNVESLPYFPPPTVNLTSGTLGNQRVQATENIGDIHKILFYTPTQTLFMAVTETDGLRSIWRLSENGKAERVFAASSGAGEITIEADSRGVIYVQHDNPSRLYRSSDGLKTWRQVLQDYGTFWQIADDGRGVIYGAVHDWNRAVLYRSPDNGFSWEPWKDFQQIFPDLAVRYDPNDDRYRLRHLHGVIYDQVRDQLLVGTGDVARFTFLSADDGATWKKIWDEGFTSSVRMSGGDRYLLGPDQLHGHGIALYDGLDGSLKEVWNPIPYNYAGYVYSIINVDGIYYAATHTEANEVDSVRPKFGIIASPDGVTWYPFLEWEPLEHHARTDIWLASAPNEVYASINGSLYVFRPLDKGWFEDKTPFK